MFAIFRRIIAANLFETKQEGGQADEHLETKDIAHNTANADSDQEIAACASELINALAGGTEGAGTLGHSVQERVERAIDQNRLPTHLLCAVIAEAFSNHSLSRYANGDSMGGVDLSSLLEHVRSQPTCAEALSEKGKLHKVFIATAILGSVTNRDGIPGEPDASVSLSRGFEQALQSGHCADKRSQVDLWNKFFVAAISFASVVPTALTDYACEGMEHRAKVTARLSLILRHVDKWDWADAEMRVKGRRFAIDVLESMVDSDATDSVAMLACGHALRDMGQYEESRRFFRMAVSAQAANGVGKKAQCDKRLNIARTFDSQLRDMRRARCGYDEVAEVEKQARECYEGVLRFASEHGVDPDPYAQHYARFLKSNRRFNDAERVIGAMGPGYRRSLEEGMLYSSLNVRSGYEKRRFLDFPRAINCYRDAWHELNEVSSVEKGALLSILYPLASTLERSGDVQSACQVARYALTIKHEKKLCRMLERMGCSADRSRTEHAPVPSVLAIAEDGVAA